MYYTGKGDKGTSNLFNPSLRVSKSDKIFAVLGSLDELNSWLGFVSVESRERSEICEIVKYIQNDLFIIQAYFASSNINVPQDLVILVEKKIDDISKVIKPRKSFVISGGSKLSALLDFSRTIARKAERQAVSFSKQNKIENPLILPYLNRLSSLLYVLARWENDLSGKSEASPNYRHSN